VRHPYLIAVVLANDEWVWLGSSILDEPHSAAAATRDVSRSRKKDAEARAVRDLFGVDPDTVEIDVIAGFAGENDQFFRVVTAIGGPGLAPDPPRYRPIERTHELPKLVRNSEDPALIIATQALLLRGFGTRTDPPVAQVIEDQHEDDYGALLWSATFTAHLDDETGPTHDTLDEALRWATGRTPLVSLLRGNEVLDAGPTARSEMRRWDGHVPDGPRVAIPGVKPPDTDELVGR